MLKVTVEGVGDLIARLQIVRRGAADLRELNTWGAVRAEFYKVQKEIFAAEGPGWKALSSPYKERKAIKYGNKPILQASGAMYKEFTGSPGGVEETAQEMTLTFSSPAGYHMSKGARSKIPYRSSLDLTPEQNKRLMDVIKKKMEQLIDNARLRSIRGF